MDTTLHGVKVVSLEIGPIVTPALLVMEEVEEKQHMLTSVASMIHPNVEKMADSTTIAAPSEVLNHARTNLPRSIQVEFATKEDPGVLTTMNATEMSFIP